MSAEARKAREACALSLRIPNTQTADCSPYEIVSVVLGRSPPLATAVRVEISIEGSRSSCLCCLPLRLSSPNPPARQRDGARFGATLRPAGAMAPLSRGVPALISSPALMSALLAFRYARARVADVGFYSHLRHLDVSMPPATSPTDLPTPLARHDSSPAPPSQLRAIGEGLYALVRSYTRESERGRGHDGSPPDRLFQCVFSRFGRDRRALRVAPR